MYEQRLAASWARLLYQSTQIKRDVVCSTVIRTTSRHSWIVFSNITRPTDAWQYGKGYKGMVITEQNENKHNL